jgi:transmembrane sensor
MKPGNGPEWVVRMRSGALTRRERRRMKRWMDAAPEHARELLRAETAWRLSGALENDESLRRELAELDAMPPAPGGFHRWRQPLLATAALALAVLGVFALSSRAPTYSTLIGEQRTVVLPDGSTMALNTGTKVEVRYTAQRRTLHLLHGEALFHVAHDARRPFIVHNSAGTVRAVGTRFNVLADETGAITVSVLEGRVAVTPGSKARRPKPALLDAGESVACTSDGALAAPLAGQASFTRIAAWREGKLRFDAWPLEQAVREYNRYAEQPVILDAVTDHGVLVSGVFRINDTDTFLKALVELVDGRLIEDGEVLRLTTREDSPLPRI